MRTPSLKLLRVCAIGLFWTALACGTRQAEPESRRSARPAPKANARGAPAPTEPHVGLEPQLRRAFERQPGFDPLPPPGPGDWRARFDEPEQSVAQFERGPRVVPTSERKTIFVLPIGSFAGRSPPLALLAEYVRRFVGLPVEVLPAVPAAAFTVRKRMRSNFVEQLLSGDLLDALRARVPPNGYGLVGVTMSDLFPAPSWNYVFGEARFDQRVRVYSFARYDPAFHGEPRGTDSDHRMLERSLKVMTHEIGHMFGIAHCAAYRCLMNGSNSLPETDAAPLHLCPICLRKLQLAVGFSPEHRYRALQAFYVEHGYEREAVWAGDRVTYIEGRSSPPPRGEDRTRLNPAAKAP